MIFTKNFFPIVNRLILFSSVLFLLILSVAYTKHLLKNLQRIRISGLNKTSWNKASGIIFGADKCGRIVCSPSDKEGHILIAGGSGSGKTSALLLPTLLKFQGNFFAIDISGDITSVVNRENLLIFSPCSPDTVPYDIFSSIDKISNPEGQYEQLEKLAFLIMPDIPGSSDATRFFVSEGRKILIAALIAFYPTGMDFCDICREIIGSSYIDLFRTIDAKENSMASLYIKSFRGTNSENVGGCKQSVDAAIKLFALNRNVRNSVHRPCGQQLSFAPRVLEDSNVIVRLDETLLDVYAPLLRIIVAQSLAYFSSRPIGKKPTILFALDEFPSLGKMDITGSLQKLRKRNIRIAVVLQSLSDLDRCYGVMERKSMLNNFRYTAILSINDPDTQEYYSKLLGHKDTRTYSKTTGDGGTSITEREEKTWAIEPASLGRLRKKLVLLHPAGYDLLRKTPYYKYEKQKRTKS